MNDRILNIGLVPVEEEDRKSLIELSNRFSQSQKSLYNLGENSIPHVTLLQLRCKEWFDINSIDFDFDYYAFVRTMGFAVDQHEGVNYLWLRVFKSYVLEKVQERIYDLFADNDDFTVINKVGRYYDPHFTMSAWDAHEPVPSFVPDKELMGKSIKTRLAIGESGDYYQFKKVLISL